MKWTRATEETIPKSSGFPIMLIVKWFEGEGDDERTLVKHMTANQLLDKVKGTWNYHYYLDETPTPESQWPTHIEIADKYVGIQMEDFELSDFGVAVKLVEWLKDRLQTSGVREGTREAELEKCLGEIANSDPYPEDVFLPVSDELLMDIQKLLMKTYSMPLDRLSAQIGRTLLKGIQAKAKSLLGKTI